MDQIHKVTDLEDKTSNQGQRLEEPNKAMGGLKPFGTMKVLTFVLMVLVGLANGNYYDYDYQEEFQLEEELLANAETSKEEIQSLKLKIQNLSLENKNLEQTTNDFVKFYEDCSKERKLSRTLIEDLKSQNQNLTKSLQTLKDSILNQNLLFTAAENGNIDLVGFLLELGADVNAEDDYRETQECALHYASENGHLGVVKLLLENGADVNAKGRWGMTPLHLATLHGHFEIAQLLLQQGADVNAKYNYEEIQESPLHYAAKKGHLEVVKLLVENGADVDTKDKWEKTPLHFATKYGHFEIAKILLQHGADVNAKSGRWYPLHLAAAYARPKFVDLFLKHGANKYLKDGRNKTPLQYAQTGIETTVMEYYDKDKMENYIKVRALLQNPLIINAAVNGQVEEVKSLLDLGADVNVRNGSDWTPLHFAAWNGHSTVASILLQNDARVDAVTIYRSTPLHLAWKGGLEVAEVLIISGAKIDARDVDKMTPLHWACKEGNLEVAEFLLQNGADLGAKDKDGRTPLYWAMDRRSYFNIFG